MGADDADKQNCQTQQACELAPVGGDESQERGRDQQAADDGYHHRDVDAGSKRRKRGADGGESRRRSHAGGFPLRKIGFAALPVGSLKHHRDSPARARAVSVKAGQAARGTQARCLQPQEPLPTPHRWSLVCRASLSPCRLYWNKRNAARNSGVQSNRTAVVFAPLTTTATRSSGAGLYLPESRAPKAAAPPGSATTRTLSHSASCAARMSSSEISTERSTKASAIGNMNLPTRFGASESAAMPSVFASTGWPAARARQRVGEPSGSSAMIFTRPRHQAAMPPIKPPPPTATSSVSTSGRSASISQPMVPCPNRV